MMRSLCLALLAIAAPMAFAQNLRRVFIGGIALPDRAELLAVTKESQVAEPNRVALFRYDLKAAKKESVALLEDQRAQDVLRIYRHAEKPALVYVLFQTRFTGYGKPDLYSLDLAAKKWSLLEAGIACVNIEKYTVRKNEIVLSCGADPLFPPKAKTYTLKAPGVRETKPDERLSWAGGLTNPDIGIEARELRYSFQSKETKLDVTKF